MTNEELHQEFLMRGAASKEAIHRCKLLLPAIWDRRLWRKKGFSSIYEYAAKLAGLSQWQVSDAIRILRKVEDKPKLKALAEERGLGAIRPVVTIASVETEDFWSEKVKEMSQHTLESYVRTYRLENGRAPKSSGEIEVKIMLRKDLHDKLQRIGDLNKILVSLIDGFEEKPEPKRTNSRHIPASIRRYVLKRSGGKCAYPGCKKVYEILHHTQRFALDKVHDPDLIQALCKGHERIAHHGLIANEDSPPSEWKLRENPDRNRPHFWIDQLVALYRSG